MMFESVSRHLYKNMLIIFFKIHLDEDSANIQIKIDPVEVSHTCWVDQNDITQILNKQPGQVDGRNADGTPSQIDYELIWPWYTIDSQKGLSYAGFRCIERMNEMKLFE